MIRKPPAMILPLVLLLAAARCSSDSSASADNASATRDGGTNGPRAEAGAAPEPEASSRCRECTSSAECATEFCSSIASSDLADLVGVGFDPQAGRCATPGDTGRCNCGTGVISGSKLCVGTGCPPGEVVTFCEHLSGVEFGETAPLDPAPPQPMQWEGCLDFVPCGGELTGTWQFIAGCADLAATSDLTDTCPAATATAVVDPSGTITFSADGSYSISHTTNVQAEVVVPKSCLPTSSCSLLSGDIEVEERGTNCVVKSASVVETTENGTFEVAGTNIRTTFVNESGSPETSSMAYCVDGSHLTISALDLKLVAARQ